MHETVSNYKVSLEFRSAVASAAKKELRWDYNRVMWPMCAFSEFIYDFSTKNFNESGSRGRRQIYVQGRDP